MAGLRRQRHKNSHRMHNSGRRQITAAAPGEGQKNPNHFENGSENLTQRHFQKHRRRNKRRVSERARRYSLRTSRQLGCRRRSDGRWSWCVPFMGLSCRPQKAWSSPKANSKVRFVVMLKWRIETFLMKSYLMDGRRGRPGWCCSLCESTQEGSQQTEFCYGVR